MIVSRKSGGLNLLKLNKYYSFVRNRRLLQLIEIGLSIKALKTIAHWPFVPVYDTGFRYVESWRNTICIH